MSEMNAMNARFSNNSWYYTDDAFRFDIPYKVNCTFSEVSPYHKVKRWKDSKANIWRPHQPLKI